MAIECGAFKDKDKYGREIMVGTHIYNLKEQHCGEVICEAGCVKISFVGGAVIDFDQYFKLHKKHIKVTKNDEVCYDKKCEEKCKDLAC